MLDYFSYTYKMIAPEKAQICKTLKMMYAFAWCPSCLVCIWPPHPSYVPCFLLPFSIVSWWAIPRDFPLHPPTAVVGHVVWKKVLCYCITTSRKLSVICSRSKSFLLKRFPTPPFSLIPNSPTPSPKLTNLHVSQVSIRWEVNHLFSIILWESDLIHE